MSREEEVNSRITLPIKVQKSEDELTLENKRKKYYENVSRLCNEEVVYLKRDVKEERVGGRHVVSNVCKQNKFIDKGPGNARNNWKVKREMRNYFRKMRRLERNNWLKSNHKFSVQLPCFDVKLSDCLYEKCLLDSGSTVNLLSRKLLNKLLDQGLVKQISSSDVECFTACNDTINIIGSCVIRIKVKNFTWNVKFLISNNIVWDLLLGVEFIRNTGLVLNLSENEFFFKFKPEVKIKCSGKESIMVNNVTGQSELNVGCSEARKAIEDLVKRYPTVYTERTGKALNYEYRIKLINPNTVINERPYPVAAPKIEKFREILKDLENQGIIRPSVSEFNSPAFLVDKGNGNQRLVINFTKLNKEIIKNSYPLGDLADCHHFLSNAEYFSVLDMCNSFFQIPLSEDSKKYTAFSTVYQKYEFNTIPQGLHVGSGVLSSYLDGIFADEKFRTLLNFIDDIIVFSPSLHSHISDLESVSKKLRDNNITISPKKAKFCSREVSFLGNIIKKGEISIDPARTVALRNFERPTSQKAVHRFIGMMSYYARYVPEFAKLAAPLNELRKGKNKKLNWTLE